MSSIINQTAFLRTSREFPEDLHQLCVEVNKAYVETANNVNDRTIGLYPKNRPAITGEAWFITDKNNKQQTLRQAYTFTAAGAITTGLKTIPTITRGFGSYTDGTNQYGLIFGSNTAIPKQVSFYVNKPGNQVLIQVLSGAEAPTISKGIVVIEWLSQV